MWETVTQISTGIALAAFIVAAAVTAYRANLKNRIQTLQAVPAGQRGEIIARELNAFNIKGKDLTRAQQYDLAIRELNLRRDRMKAATTAVIVVAVLAASLAVTAMVTGGRASDDKPSPGTSGAFEIYRHERSVDLGGWKETVPGGEKDKMSKASWVDRFKLKRLHPDVKEFVLRRAVTGAIEPEFSSTTHRLRAKITSERPQEGPRPIERLYDVVLDVSGEPVNQWFDLQVNAAYWNVFSKKEDQWVGVPVQFKTGDIYFELKSPNKPFKSFQREAYPRNGKAELANEPNADLSEDHKIINWRIANVQTNWIYKITWEW